MTPVPLTAAAVVPPAGPLLRTVALTKHYPGVKALDGVDFELAPGEVHALFGENGAGKSTLISLVAGANTPTSGQIVLDGREVTIGSVLEARARGISAVFQEFSLVPTLTVAENLFLGAEPRRAGLVDKRAMVARARTLLADLQFDLDPRRRVGTLTRAEQQMVEIAKGFRSRLRVLILDEPTASLTDRETERLFALVERLKAEGAGIIYITHRMQEIHRIADRVTVLRDGRRIDTVDAKSTSEERLITLMTGRSITEVYPTIARRADGDVLLEVDGLSSTGGVRDASLVVRRGEVVGLAGLVGSGKSELMRAVFGIDRTTAGRVRFKGEDVTHRRPADLLARGLFYLPPDRKDEGLVLTHTSRANIALPALRRLANGVGLLPLGPQRALVKRAASAVELADRNVGRAVALLSGGNQQKVLFAKGLGLDADLYVLDEPTVGVDVGTRSALYTLIQRLCEGGAGVVVVSSDLPEVLHLSHRVYVTYGGRIVGERVGDEITEASVLGLFFDRARAAA